MRRREFISIVGGAAAWPLVAPAQTQRLPTIGFLSLASPEFSVEQLGAFRQGLAEEGYFEGKNVAIEYRWAENRREQLATLAADLVRRDVNVIVALGGSAPALSAKAATTIIPIVYSAGGDPVKLGLTDSLSRPGGNVTGVVSLGTELMPKLLELLHELVPTANTMASLINPTAPSADAQAISLQNAAKTLGLDMHVLQASGEKDFDAVFMNLVNLRAGGLVIGADAVFDNLSDRLAALTLRRAVPSIFSAPGFAAAGGLMSYGGDLTSSVRQVGLYTGRILKGDKPADLPVMQASKVELIINLKTAMALGLTVPLPLLGRADEVIE